MMLFVSASPAFPPETFDKDVKRMREDLEGDSKWRCNESIEKAGGMRMISNISVICVVVISSFLMKLRKT